MADTVRYLLEEMVPELEDLEQRGYFSRAEIKQIVRKREDFEYSLKRRAALKEDYGRYIQYESKLEQLRLHRRKERGITGKKSLSDYCITRRIHFIYERATRKFRGDLSLWSRWLAFCQRTGSSRQMSRALTKALQLHPTAPSLWTYAAAWEFEHNLNASAARALMQRGLRMCKDTPALWHEYFRMELLYAMRLRERRRVLGIEDAVPSGGNEKETDGEVGDESAAAVQAVLNGAVAAVVYRSAVKAVPQSVGFRRKFLDILQPFDFPGKKSLEDLIYSSVSADFGANAQAWDLEARREILAAHASAVSKKAAHQAVQAAVRVYRQAVQSVETPEMYGLFAAFLEEQLQDLLHREEGTGSGLKGRTRLHSRGSELALQLLDVYAQSAIKECLTEEMALKWPKLHLRQGDPTSALHAARHAANALPRSIAVWQQLIALDACQMAYADVASSAPRRAGVRAEAEGGGSSSDEEAPCYSDQQQQLEGLAMEALQSVGPQDAGPLWLSCVQALVGCGAPLQRLSQMLLQTVAGLARGPVEGGMGAVAAALVLAMEHCSGVEEARRMYRELFKLPAAGGELMHAVLDLELRLVECAERTAQPLTTQELLAVFEAAIGAYGERDWKLWVRYLQFEQHRNKGAGQLYWRAIKMLEDPQQFIGECQRLHLH